MNQFLLPQVLTINSFCFEELYHYDSLENPYKSLEKYLNRTKNHSQHSQATQNISKGLSNIISLSFVNI